MDLIDWVQLEQKAGVPLANLVKQLYFPDTPWSVSLAKQIGHMMGVMKRAHRKMVPEDNVVTCLEYLVTLDKFDLDVLLETT